MPTKLQSLIEQGESQTCEFKLAFGEEVLETIGAFANAKGGSILIGVNDDGTTTGIAIGKKTVEDWAHNIQNTTDPRLQPDIQFVNIEKKKIGIINVARTTGLPVSIKGRFLKRVGRTNQRMSHEEIMQRLLASSATSWDSIVEPRASLEDLSMTQVRNFLTLVRQTKRRPLPPKISAKAVLEKLQLVKNGTPTRAALLLFAKKPTRYFPAAYVRLGRFKSPILIIDDKRVDGNILQQIDECMLWFRERFQTEYVITGKPQRDVIWEYPLDAVREALVNALCHRDYLINTNIQVRMYDSQLEFWNPGGLLPPLTPADLFRKHDSIPRNLLIADCLFYSGIIESWGSGTTRIASALAESGLVPPEFIAGNSYRFGLVFRQERFIAPLLKQLKLPDRQAQAVMFLMFKEENLTNEQYQKLFVVSKRTASSDLNQLVKKRILIKHGFTGKGVYYTLVQKYKSKGASKGQRL